MISCECHARETSEASASNVVTCSTTWRTRTATAKPAGASSSSPDPASYQDAEKRILNGKSQMGNGKNLANLPSPICHFRSGRGFSAACYRATDLKTRSSEQSFTHEIDPHIHRDFNRDAIEERRIELPLADGCDRGLGELGM
jgi:hypothetical protein